MKFNLSTKSSWLSLIAFLVLVYLLVVAFQPGKSFRKKFINAGGATGLSVLVTTITGVFVFFYLLETQKIREAEEERSKPYLGFTFEPPKRAPVPEPETHSNPTLNIRNFGQGPAIDVILFFESIPDSLRGQEKFCDYVAVLSSAPSGMSQIASFQDGRIRLESLKGMRIGIGCLDVAKRSFVWIYSIEGRVPDFHRIEFRKTEKPGTFDWSLFEGTLFACQAENRKLSPGEKAEPTSR